MKTSTRAYQNLFVLFIICCSPAHSQSASTEAEKVCSEFVGLYRKNELEAAEKLIRSAIETERTKKLPDPQNLLPFYRNLATVLRKQNKLDEVAQVEAEIKHIEYGVALQRSNVRAVNASTERLQPGEQSDGTDDYLKFTNPKQKWDSSKMPLKVFIKSGDGVPGYKPQFQTILKEAFSDWTKASNDKISFEFVDLPGKAQIECSWAEKGEDSHSGLTMAIPNRTGEIEEAHIRLFTYNMAAVNFATNAQVKSTSLHEIGHALGIKGHSDRSSDIMYAVSIASTISARDKRTLAALYSGNLLSKNESSMEADKQKLVSVSEEAVWVPSAVSQLAKDGTGELNKNNRLLAIEKFKLALEQAPNYAFGKRALANAYAGLAIENWHHPEFALCLLHRSYFTDAQESTYRSIEMLMRNMNLDPKKFEDRVQLAEYALKNSDSFGAIFEYKEALKIKSSPEVQDKLKAIKHPSILTPDIDRSKLSSLSRPQNLIQRNRGIQRSDEMNDSHSEASELNNQGVAELRSGNYLLSAKKFLAALKISPDYLVAQRNLAAAFNNLGIYSTAENNESLSLFHLSCFLNPSGPGWANLDCAVSNSGKSPRSYEDRLSMGDEALAKGDRVGAIVEYSEALKIKDNPDLKKKLENIPKPKIPDDTALPSITFKEQKASPVASGPAPIRNATQAPGSTTFVVHDKKSPSAVYHTSSKSLGTISGSWHGSIHVDSGNFQVVMQIDQKGNIISGSITCTGGGGISKHHFKGALDPKKGMYVCKDIGVERIEGSNNWFPAAVDQYSIHLVENGSKVVGSCTQGNRKNWFSLTR